MMLKKMPTLNKVEEDKRSNAENQDNVNKFPISLQFKTPVNQMMTQFIFTSSDRMDIRIYKMNLTISPLPIKVNLSIPY